MTITGAADAGDFTVVDCEAVAPINSCPLCEIAGLKFSEIALHQNSNPGAVKVKVHRAKKALVEILNSDV